MKHCAEYEKKEKCIAVSCGTQPFKKKHCKALFTILK